MAELPGKELAQELMQQSREESRHTPMEAVVEAAKQGKFAEEEGFRLIGRLWTLERLFYYIYGGWGQGLEVNDFPPAVKYLFARQMDGSTRGGVSHLGWCKASPGAPIVIIIDGVHVPKKNATIVAEGGSYESRNDAAIDQFRK